MDKKEHYMEDGHSPERHIIPTCVHSAHDCLSNRRGELPELSGKTDRLPAELEISVHLSLELIKSVEEKSAKM